MEKQKVRGAEKVMEVCGEHSASGSQGSARLPGEWFQLRILQVSVSSLQTTNFHVNFLDNTYVYVHLEVYLSLIVNVIKLVRVPRKNPAV